MGKSDRTVGDSAQREENVKTVGEWQKKISGGQSVENSEKVIVKTVGEWRQKSEEDRVS